MAQSESNLTYYYFDEPALNTFDYDVVTSRLELTDYKLVKQQIIPVFRLDHLLKKHLPQKQRIDFLTIDVEGFDFNVVKSNDWELYRPFCVVVEALNSDLEECINGAITTFLNQQGYRIFAKTNNSIIFIDKRH